MSRRPQRHELTGTNVEERRAELFDAVATRLRYAPEFLAGHHVDGGDRDRLDCGVFSVLEQHDPTVRASVRRQVDLVVTGRAGPAGAKVDLLPALQALAMTCCA